ncbi:MAG TPA: hypothetical protein VJS37_08390 [Terriglobales bacterium]|nr:hypothetical protein [Terriglobales bacterium]
MFLLAAATIVDGLLAGASVDQSVEQLPARHRIGVRAYHAYTQASHMANGRFWLIPLGIVGPILRVAAIFWVYHLRLAEGAVLSLGIAAVLAVGHLLLTMRAGSINWALTPWQPPERQIKDELELAKIFQRFERWQAVRASVQLLTFVVGVWALVAVIQ